MKSVYLEQYDGFIRYLDFAGEGPVRLYLPGLASAAVLFVDTIQQDVLKNNRSILVDYFGSGFSDAPATLEYTLEEYVEMVVAVLRKENLEQVEVVGHSMGGTIAIQLAWEHPELVSKLVICEANIEPGGGVGTAQIVAQGYQKYKTEGLSRWRSQMRQQAIAGNVGAGLVLAVWRHSTVDAIFKGSEMLVNLPADFKDRLFALTPPVTFIYGESNLPGESGNYLPDVPDPEELAAHGIKTAIIPHSGHMMMSDNLQGFASAIAESLR